MITSITALDLSSTQYNIAAVIIIAILGRGGRVNANVFTYAECEGAVDCVARGARLYREGNAKRVRWLDAGLNTLTLQMDLGGPREDIEYIDGIGNTEK